MSLTHTTKTFLFYDFETFNLKSKGGRVSQFASIRTDEDLKIIDHTAINLFCEQTIDNIPSPIAALTTGLTPQKIKRIKDGVENPPQGNISSNPQVLNEYFFTKRILEEMCVANTCTLGYNSILFDDEFTRNLAYRNLNDPYEREWKDNNSRFDVFHLVMATYVLRPQLLVFPVSHNKTTGEIELNPLTNNPLPSLRLEDLSVANGISHGNAHDAFSDVEATIGLMKKVKDQDNEFFNQILDFKYKRNVFQWLLKNNGRPFVHISQFYGKVNNLCAVVKYAIPHPTQNSAIICIDLSKDIAPIINLNTDDLSKLVFSKREELADINQERPGIVVIRGNQCPVLADINDIKDRFETLNIDPELLRRNLDLYNQNEKSINEKLNAIYNTKYEIEIEDTDLMIYSSGFFSDNEKAMMFSFHRRVESGEVKDALSHVGTGFLYSMALKLIARNFSSELTLEGRNWWMAYARERISNKYLGAEYTIQDFNEEILELKQSDLSHDKLAILEELEEYVDTLKRTLNL